MKYFFTFIFILSSQISFADTHIFYIAGDDDFYGTNSKFEFKDQAVEFYKKILHAARTDKNNNYLIFKDTSKREKTDAFTLYEQGEHREIYFKSRTRYRREVDSTAITNYKVLAHLLRSIKNIGLLTFYYYGEHIPSNEISGYDRSHPNSRFSASQFKKGLEQIRPVHEVDFLVLQSCDNNTSSFIKEISDTVNNIVIPIGKISNRAIDVKNVYQNLEEAEELVTRLNKFFSFSKRYKYIYVNEELSNYHEQLEKIISKNTDQECMDSEIKFLISSLENNDDTQEIYETDQVAFYEESNEVIIKQSLLKDLIQRCLVRDLQSFFYLDNYTFLIKQNKENL